MLGSEGSIWGVIGTSAMICAAVYLLWRHHPSYGGNPGLPCFPLVGSMPHMLLNKHRFYDWSCEIFERAHVLTIRSFIGSVTLIGTIDPQNVRHILKSQFEHYPKGPTFHAYFSDLLGFGIFNCDGPLWRFQRKVASHIFTSSSLKDFVIEIGNAEIRHRLLPALDFACVALCGRPIDLQAMLMDFTMDTISQLTFGTDPACLTTCKVIISHVNADVQHAEVDVKADVQHAKGYAQHAQADVQHAEAHVQHNKLHADLRTQLDNTHAKPYVQLDSAKGLELRAEHDGHNVLASSKDNALQESKKRMTDSTASPSYMKVPDDLIQGFVHGFPVALQITADRLLKPSFIWQTQRALKIGSEKKLLNALEAVNKFTSFVIEKSKCELGNERKDLLFRFMHLSNTQVESLLVGKDEAAWKANNTDEHEQMLSDSLLKNILLSFILAGRETVASGITFMMWLLCLNETVQTAIHGEIEGIVKERNAGEKMGTFSFEELKQMNYLQAALSESMRLYPPVPSNAKFAAQDDVLPDGTRVRKGNRVSYNAIAMGRAEKVWGEDCLKFRPERWIGEDGQFVAMSPYKYPVFQAGPRMCLGKDFAFIQMKLIVASLVRNFEFKVSSGFKPQLSYGVTTTMRNGLPMTIKRRQQTSCA